jgi:hypothetical protein
MLIKPHANTRQRNVNNSRASATFMTFHRTEFLSAEYKR